MEYNNYSCINGHPSEPKFEFFLKMFVIYLRILKMIENKTRNLQNI